MTDDCALTSVFELAADSIAIEDEPTQEPLAWIRLIEA